MKWLIAITALLVAAIPAKAEDSHVSGTLVKTRVYRRGVIVAPRRVVIPPGPTIIVPPPSRTIIVPAPRVPWRRGVIIVPAQSCPDGKCQRHGDSFQDRLDGGELPDDLFGGIPDPRGGQGGGSGSGHTSFILP